MKHVKLERNAVKGIYSQQVEKNSKSTITVASTMVNGGSVEALPVDEETVARPGKKQEPTMEDRLNTLLLQEDAPSKRNRNQVGTPNSIHQMLIQAIHSNDKQLLETCLAVHDQDVIGNTVKRLPTVQVVAFLNQIIDRFQHKPNRGSDMLVWIRAVLLHHTPYLLTVRSCWKLN